MSQASNNAQARLDRALIGAQRKTICSGGVGRGVRRGTAGAYPCRPFLPKPFTPERLARKVREVLDAPDA